MSIEKRHIAIACEQCRFCREDGCGGFDVEVPISDKEQGIQGLARIHCVTDESSHRVELESWQDADGTPLSPPEDTSQRLGEALELVAQRRLCGNGKLCPQEIVRVVARSGGASGTTPK